MWRYLRNFRLSTLQPGALVAVGPVHARNPGHVWRRLAGPDLVGVLSKWGGWPFARHHVHAALFGVHMRSHSRVLATNIRFERTVASQRHDTTAARTTKPATSTITTSITTSAAVTTTTLPTTIRTTVAAAAAPHSSVIVPRRLWSRTGDSC